MVGGEVNSIADIIYSENFGVLDDC